MFKKDFFDSLIRKETKESDPDSLDLDKDKDISEVPASGIIGSVLGMFQKKEDLSHLKVIIYFI